MKRTISKSVVAITITGIALTSYVVWHGLHRQDRANLDASFGARVEDADPADDASPARHGTVLAAPVPLPLGVIVVEAENGMWSGDKGWRSVPRGPQIFGGIEFRLEGIIETQGTGSEYAGQQYRSRIPLPLAQAGVTNARIGSIHLLGGTSFESQSGAAVAELVWRYSDGVTRRSRLVYGEHVRNWSRLPYEEPAHLPYAYTKVVFSADEATADGRWFRLYRVTLGNPEPAKPVRQIDLVSARGTASLVVVGVTLDPLAPGIRAEDSPDLEPNDASAPQHLDLWVQTPEGQPVPKAKIVVQWRLKSDLDQPPSRHAVTDADGMTRIAYPPANLSKLEITASRDDFFASRKMVWDLVAGDVVPSSYTLKLLSGVNIGGVIVDSSDSPIPDAKLEFHRFWTGSDQIDRKGEQSDFGSRTAMSDSQGAWQMKNLPLEILGNISFFVQHSEYLGTNLTVRGSGELEKQLLAGTHKIVLRRGLGVRGLVTDENGSPIADATVATVWAGHRFSFEQQQTNSDNAGRFAFRGIAEGDVLFSAIAKGRTPASKTFKVQAGMEDVVLKLGAGGAIRGVVQSQAGEPIPDVRVSLENHGPSEPGYEFSTSTDAKGRFEWSGAPNEAMSFYFGKKGYAQRRNVRLKLDEENVVTLRNSRDVQGQVRDADSGQPVTKFRAVVGRSFGLDQFFSNYPGTKEFADANGQFTLSVDEEDQNAIRVGADDYADQIQSLPSDQDGVIKLEFRLKPSAALHGVVIGSEGLPKPGVQVTLTKESIGGGFSVSWRKGKFETHGDGAPVVVTDADGKFSIGSPPETGGNVIALGEVGFGSASVGQVRESGLVMLRPFGQIEGVLKIGGEPASGRELMFTLQNIGVMTDFEKFKVETDDQGKFKFENLPAVEGQIVRLIKNSPRSWTHSHATTVTVEPGQTVYVTLGDSGGLIKGHVRLETLPGDGEPLAISGNLNTSFGKPPSFNSPAESQAFFQSPDWRARMKQQKNFALVVNPDGSFLIDSVPPGSYTLRLSVSPPGSGPFGDRSGGPTATRTVDLTVPDNPDPQVPIDMGEIILSAVAKRTP